MCMRVADIDACAAAFHQALLPSRAEQTDARSIKTARVVVAWSNIEAIKLFARNGAEERHVLSAMRRLRLRFRRVLRLTTELTPGLNIIKGVLIQGVLGPALWLRSRGAVWVGEVPAAAALTVRLNGMSG